MPAQGGQRVNPLDLRTDQSLPAFSHCSLDDDPGSGAPDDGAPSGQSNVFLTWNTRTIVDEAALWSVSIALTDRTPHPTATVDITPRRLQRFKLAPGDKVLWTNTRGAALRRAASWSRIAGVLPRCRRFRLRATRARSSSDGKRRGLDGRPHWQHSNAPASAAAWLGRRISEDPFQVIAEDCEVAAMPFATSACAASRNSQMPLTSATGLSASR